MRSCAAPSVPPKMFQISPATTRTPMASQRRQVEQRQDTGRSFIRVFRPCRRTSKRSAIVRGERESSQEDQRVLQVVVERPAVR